MVWLYFYNRFLCVPSSTEGPCRVKVSSGPSHGLNFSRAAAGID